MPSNRKIIRDEIVPAGAPWGGTRKKDQRLRIVDCEPRQAVDFLCYNELEAAMDAVAVLSNRPRIDNPANDYNPTPVRVIVSA